MRSLFDMRWLNNCRRASWRAMRIGAWSLGGAVILSAASVEGRGRADQDQAPYTPAAGSPERLAIMDAIRTGLRTTARFEVSHLRVSGSWAFIRCGEVVALEGGERQETDLYVVALLKRDPAPSTRWRVLEHWTLQEDRPGIYRAFADRVERRIKSQAIPRTILPRDFPN